MDYTEAVIISLIDFIGDKFTNIYIFRTTANLIGFALILIYSFCEFLLIFFCKNLITFANFKFSIIYCNKTYFILFDILTRCQVAGLFVLVPSIFFSKTYFS